MPKSCVNYHQYKCENIGSVIRAKLFKEHKTITALAEILGITRGGMTYKLNQNIFTYPDLLTIFDFLNFSDFEILELMRLRGVQ